MSTGWNKGAQEGNQNAIINLLGNEYWLEQEMREGDVLLNYKPTGK